VNLNPQYYFREMVYLADMSDGVESNPLCSNTNTLETMCQCHKTFFAVCHVPAGAATFSITTLGIMAKWRRSFLTVVLSVVMFIVIMLSVVRLIAPLLRVIMLSAVKLSVVMLNVVAIYSNLDTYNCYQA
jgi:hypothetical protein